MMNRLVAQGFAEELRKIAASGGLPSIRALVPKSKVKVSVKSPKLGKTYTESLPPTGRNSNELLSSLKQTQPPTSEVSPLRRAM